MSEDFKGKRRKFYPVACGKIEDRTIRAKEEGRCVGQSLVSFGAKHFTTERSGLEIFERGVVGYLFCVSSSLLFSLTEIRFVKYSSLVF